MLREEYCVYSGRTFLEIAELTELSTNCPDETPSASQGMQNPDTRLAAQRADALGACGDVSRPHCAAAAWHAEWSGAGAVVGVGGGRGLGLIA